MIMLNGRMITCCGVLLFIVLTGNMVFADIYKYVDEKGVSHYTNIKSDVRYKLYIKGRDEKPDVFIKEYGSIINQASEKFNLKPSLIKAVIKAESGFDHKAVSKKGAKGLMQLMPKTASEMKVADPYKPEENIFGGAKYLSSLMKKFKNNLEHALAAYNAGPEKVEEHNGIPPYSETKEFVKRVLDYLKEYESIK